MGIADPPKPQNPPTISDAELLTALLAELNPHARAGERPLDTLRRLLSAAR